jgi:hypothetical protein
MRRISVVATIRDAYVFTATHLGGIIGLIWVSMVLLTVMGFFSSQHLYNDVVEALASSNAERMGPSLLMWLAYLIAALFLQAVMYVAVTQLALGMRGAPTWAHFAFGPAEWRMFRALLAFFGLVVSVSLLGSVALNSIARQAPQAALTVPLIVNGVILIAIARFFTLLPAISITETVPVLRRAWLLSAGNFWRLFAVLLAIVVPMFILAVLLLAPVAEWIPPLPVVDGRQTQQLAMFMWLRQTLPLLWGLLFLVWPLVIGLFAGASVSVWRALKDEPALDIAV